MIVLLLTLFKFALFLAVVATLALLTGAAISAIPDATRSILQRLMPLPQGDPVAGADALECKADLARGQRETEAILAQNHGACGHSHGSSGGWDGGCDGDGDGSGGD